MLLDNRGYTLSQTPSPGFPNTKEGVAAFRNRAVPESGAIVINEIFTSNLSSLPDEKFFYVMRLYLGEIKTPYNKLKLIEQLASLIRNKTSLERIISFLDETDVKILTFKPIHPFFSITILRQHSIAMFYRFYNTAI